jgi:hypothetical protein
MAEEQNQDQQIDTGVPGAIQRPAQYPTATKIENGIAYDVSGKALGPVEGQAAGPEKDDNFFAKLGGKSVQTPAQQTKSDDFFSQLGGKSVQTPSSFAGGTEVPTSTIGPRKGTAAHVSGGKDIFGREIEASPVAARMQWADWFDDLKGDLDNGSDATWVGWMLNKLPEKLGLPGGAKGLTYGVSPELGHAMGGPLYGPAMIGHGASIAQEHPVAGISEVLAGAGTTLGPAMVTQPEALPFMAIAGATSKGVSYAAKQMGADDETADLIGNVAGLVTGLKAVGKSHLVDKFESSTNTYMDAQKNYVGRLREFENASRQASDAEANAIASRKLESTGQLRREFRIKAEEDASAARSNTAKAQKALENVTELRDQAGVKMRGIARQIQGSRSLQKMDARRTREVAGAYEDFKSMAPPTASGPASYTDRDLLVARGHLENAHALDPINTTQGHYDALDNAVKQIDSQIDPHIDKYTSEPITTNVKMDVRDALGESTREDFVQKGMKALEPYNLTDPTMGEARDILKDLNAENRAVLKKNFWDIGTALRVDPEFAARHAAAESLRTGIDGTLQDHGVDGIRPLRSDQASIIKVRNAVERQLTRGGQTVRGTGQSGPTRRAAAFATQKGTTALGAKVAGPKGALVGDIVGEKLGRLIAPGDLTRDELAARTMEVKGAGRPINMMTGEGTPAERPMFETPPVPSTAMSPEDIQKIQREFGPLHGELATHYGEHVSDISYGELEHRFIEDIADKQSHGVALEPAEKTLLGKINQQNAADALAAKKAAQEAAVSGKPQVREATLPENAEPSMQIMGDIPNKMNTQEVLVHELAHAVVGKEKGLPMIEIRSHDHPTNSKLGNVASAKVDFSEFEKPEGGLDLNKIKDRISDIAATYVAGGVANDLWHNIPFTENLGLGVDLSALRDFIEQAGFTDAETSRMIAQAADDAAQVLSRPNVREILEQHAQVREPKLSNKLHFSEDRLQQIYQDVKGESYEPAGKSARVSGEGNKGIIKPGGRSEGEVQGRAAEGVRKESEGTSATKAAGARAESEPTGGTATGESGIAKPGEPAVSAVTQGGHAGGGVASEEELARPGRFVKISRSGVPTDQGKTPDFNLATGEAGYQVRPGGGYELKAGQETPATRRGVEGYAREVYPESPALSKIPPERSTGNLEHDRAIKEGGGIPGGILGHPEDEVHVKMFHDPQTGTTLGFSAKEPVTAEQTRAKIAASRAQYAAGEKRSPAVSAPEKESELERLRRTSPGVREKIPETVAEHADAFNKTVGRAPVNAEPIPHSPELANRIAKAYEVMPHNPNDPEVQKAYGAMKKDIDDQWNYATDQMGIKFEPWKRQGQPYGDSKEMIEDVRDNKHLYFFQGGEMPADHPLAVVDPKTGFSYNDKLRAVHDLFGHAAHQFQFGPKGEENAWNVHRQMFSPEAVPALTTETRGQNSWVNFGEHLRNTEGNIPKKDEPGYIPPTERPYAENKAGILPEEFHKIAPKQHWSEKIASNLEQQPSGGINPNNPDQPSKRYGFEILPEARQALEKNPTAEDFRQYADQHGKEIGSHPDIKLGWDTTGPKPELNIGAATDDLAKAKQMAAKLDQRALWDNQAEKTIDTGGKGEKTSFPEYPFEKRLEDLNPALSPKGSTVPLMENPLKMKGTGEDQRITTIDVAKELKKFTNKQFPALELGKAESKEQVERAKSIAEDEARYQLAQNNTGAAWYTTDMAKHDQVIQKMRPELQDPAKMSLFKMTEAVLSSGQRPTGNVKAALHAWDNYQETGKFSPVNPDTRQSWGPRGIKAYGNAMEMLNRLITEKGEKGASDWLLTEHPIKELRQYNTSSTGGGGGGVAGKADDMLPGVYILGRKRGPFAQNLHGQESAFTADMWVARSWNRWMGTTEVSPDGEITTDSPRSGKEQSLMKQSFKETADKLGMSTSSLQAALWYYEKHLYDLHGAKASDSWSFSDAAQRAADDEASSFKFGANAPEKK